MLHPLAATRLRRPLGLAAAALVLVAGLSACGEDQEEAVPQRAPDDVPGQTDSTSPSSDPSPTDSNGEGSTAPSTEPTAPETSQASGPAECTANDLSAAYEEGDSGAGHRFGTIVVTNTSDQPCFIQGYGGLSYVGINEHSGKQIGAAAERDQGTPAERVELEPGDEATSEVSETITGMYSMGECGGEAVAGFRLYVPDETKSLFVEHATDACANKDLKNLSHQAFAAG